MEETGKKAERMLAVLSDNYFGSDYTMAELTQFLSRDHGGRKGTIVAVKIAECDLEGSLLAPRSYVDLTGVANEAAAREKLLADLKTKGTW